jgi:phage tail sheath protein FI
MLLVDPLQDWVTAQDAMAGIRKLGYASTNLISYYPRMLQRGDETFTARVVGGALAGLICKLDRKHGAWQELDRRDLGFSRKLKPAVDVDADDEQALGRAGINVVATGPAGLAQLRGSVTMGRSASRQFVSLGVTRVCLRVLNAVDEVTRWAVFAGDDTHLADRICARVTACLAGFAAMGAFENDNFIVECDAGMRKRIGGAGQGFAIFLAFQPRTANEPVAFSVHQGVAGCRVASTAFAPGLTRSAQPQIG